MGDQLEKMTQRVAALETALLTTPTANDLMDRLTLWQRILLVLSRAHIKRVWASIRTDNRERLNELYVRQYSDPWG